MKAKKLLPPIRFSCKDKSHLRHIKSPTIGTLDTL